MDKAASLSYLRALTPEEELELRKKGFEKIRERSLFDLGGERHFLAVKKIDDESWEVIELDEDNRRRIISEQKVRYCVLSLDQMRCLNLREQESRR